MPSISRFEKRPVRGRRRRIMLRVGVALLLVLIVARLLLPVVALRLANARLAELENFTGHVESAGFSLVRGEIGLDRVVFARREAGGGTFRIEVDKVEVTISWIQLFRGRLSAGIVITRPAVAYSAGATRAEAGTVEAVKNLAAVPALHGPVLEAIRPSIRATLTETFPVDLIDLRGEEIAVRFAGVEVEKAA